MDLGGTADDFDYETFLDKEFSGETSAPKRRRIKRRRMLLAMLVALFALLLTFSGWSRLRGS